MRKDWEVYSIKDLGKVITGSTPSTKDDLNYSSNDYSFVKPSDIPQNQILYIDNTECYVSEYAFKNSRILPSGTVLVTCIGIIGKVGITKNDCICNQQINAIIPNDKVNNKFLAYSIFAKREVLSLIANSPVVPIINKNDFSNIKLQLPTLQTQQQIVEELDSLTSIIEKHKKQLEELDTLAQSIFYDMFGDPFLMSNAKESVPLGSICVINPHKSELKNIDKNTLCSFVGMAQIGENGELTLEHNRAIKDVYKGFTFFREGDVLFAKITPCMENGKGAIAKRLTNKIGFGSTEFHVIRPNNKITDKYIYYLLSIPSIRKWAESKMTGAGGQRRVPTSFFDELRIILPSLPLQQQFASKIESIEKQKELIKQSLSEVQQLFDSRMDYYFN